MSKLHRQMEIDMLLGQYADDTRKTYLDAICKFREARRGSGDRKYPGLPASYGRIQPLGVNGRRS